MVPPYLPTFISCLSCPTMNLLNSHSILSALHGHTAVLPPGLFIGWCIYPACLSTLHPLLHQETSCCPKVLNSHSQTCSSQVLQSGFMSPSSVLPQPFAQTPDRTHHCPYHLLFTSCPCTRQQPTWNKCLLYQVSHIKEQFSEEVTSPLSIHTFL